jgi:hypothetical protein
VTDPRSMVRPICPNKDYEFLGHGLGLAGPLDRLSGAPTTGLKAKKALGGNRQPKKRGAVSKQRKEEATLIRALADQFTLRVGQINRMIGDP